MANFKTRPFYPNNSIFPSNPLSLIHDQPNLQTVILVLGANPIPKHFSTNPHPMKEMLHASN